MEVRLALLFIISSLQAALSLPFEGKGEVCLVSYYRTKTGVRFIYRPENYESYEGFVASARVVTTMAKRYALNGSALLASRNSSVAVQTHSLLWDANGKYFYYQSTKGIMGSHRWVAYAVFIHNSEGQLVYQDTHHIFKVSPSYGYCSLDSRGDNSSLQCSQALAYATAYQKELANKPVVSAFKGTGMMYVTISKNITGGRGVRLIYRPQNYQKYSPMGQGWIAYIGFYANIRYGEALQKYKTKVMDKRAEWRILKWDSNGKYYYYDQYDGTISQSLFGYGVDIENTDGQLIYEDTYHFYSAHTLVYRASCQLDTALDFSSGLQCSTALERNGIISKPASYFDVMAMGKGGSSLAAGLGITIGLLIFILLLVVLKLAMKKCCDGLDYLPEDLVQDESTTDSKPTSQCGEKLSMAVKLVDSKGSASTAPNTTYLSEPPPAYKLFTEDKQ